MEMKVYTLRDGLSGEWGPLFTALSDEIACRKVRHMIRSEGLDPREMVDYNLLRIGHYNVVTNDMLHGIVPEAIDFYATMKSEIVEEKE